MEQMNVFYKSPSELIPYEYNPRDNDDAAATVAESIREFGFTNPIILDTNGVIICGHARLKAALILGLDKVPCILADQLTPTQVRAFRIADNKTAEIAGWDYDALQREFEELSETDFDLNLTGFNEFEQTEYGEPDAVPDKPDRQQYKDYREQAEADILQSFNIAIVCATDYERQALAKILGETGRLKRLYRAEEIPALQTA